MAGHQPAGDRRLSRGRLRAELERAREHIVGLEADRQPGERLIDSLAQRLQDGFVLLSPDGVHLDINPAFCAMTGFTREELIGVGLPHPYWPPEERDRIEHELRADLDGSSPDSIELTFMRADGERFPVLITPTVMRDHEGEPVCIFATVKDISEQRRAEEENALLKRAIDAHADGAYWMDTSNRFVYVNDAACAMVGYAPEELIGAPLTLVNEQATPEAIEAVWERLRTKGSYTAETVHRRKDGSEFPVEIASSYVSFAGKEYNCGFARDISERKRLEEARQESEARYRSLFEDSPVAMWEQDDSAVKAHLEKLVADGVDDVIAYLLADPREYRRCIALSRTLDANKAAVELFEAAGREELLARNDDLYRRESDRGIYRFWAAMLAGERSATYEEANLSLKGRPVQVLETCTAVPGHEETFDRVYIADVDISDRKRVEEARLEGVTRLRRALGETIAALGATVAMRDPYTAGHERRVAWLACRIAERLGWSEEALEMLHTAALVHDVGKITVPAEILSKPTRLTEVEFALVRAHSAAGYDILAPIDFGDPVAEVVLQHHERLDGSGYPRGLRGEDILPGARVLAVADVVEAMISHRPYRPALPLAAALEEIGPQSRGRFDAEAAEACRRLLEDEGLEVPA